MTFKRRYLAAALAAAIAGSAAAQDAPQEAEKPAEEAPANPMMPKVRSRQQRLRDHEAKIKEILKQRQAEEERMRAEQQAKEAADRGNPGEPGLSAGDAPLPQAILSTVVMGFKFINAAGYADYNIIVEEGDTFLSEIYLFNMDQNPIDRVQLAFAYDKRFLLPEKVFDSSIRGYAATPPRFEQKTRDGIIRYEADLKEPLRQPETVLLRIKWRALRPTPYTGLEFQFSPTDTSTRPHTAIFAKGKNILGEEVDTADGVLTGAVMIDPPPTKPKVLQGKREELKEIYLGSVASKAKAGLELAAPAADIEVGDEFIVRVRLNNPEGAPIDALSFFVLYDPEVLQVVDRDRFNWIKRGTNIHDGPYHKNFPFDIFQRNEVRRERGTIHYEAAMSNGGALPTATIADIHFKALAPTSGTRVEFIKGRPGAPDLTSLKYFGYELLDLGPPYSEHAVTIPVLNPSGIAEAAPEAAKQAPKAKAAAREAEDLSPVSLPVER